MRRTDADRHGADQAGYHEEVGNYYGAHAATD